MKQRRDHKDWQLSNGTWNDLVKLEWLVAKIGKTFDKGDSKRKHGRPS
ncbi:hypothetical protein RISK_003095 [Rhodopirellula islandica]|uniref:Uncharacterized protein n=1 Tax=Rhodopirellula islandica TaxID=595434 RepID=A0A0J1BE01_RHOIS|nr:hypothetical protein RISK_003095 [Rhodopirellula islandica]